MKLCGGGMHPEWMRNVQVGSVLVSGYGAYRVVRKVSHFSNGNLRAVYFVIRRRSWTNRAYTVMTYNDLRMQGYKPTHVRSKLNMPIDETIARLVADFNYWGLTARDVIGIA